MSRPDIILHSTPPLGSLPASDVESLHLASLIQAAHPNSWAVTPGDWGATGGRVPYITHFGNLVRSGNLESLPGWVDPDASLSAKQRAEALGWKAYIEGTLTDLVNHTLYSLPPNYLELAKAQLQGLVFPENHYIPQRIRGIVKSRLSYVGLWGLGGLHDGDAADEDRRRLDEAFVVGPAGTMAPRTWSGWRSGREAERRRRKWGEEELLRRARGALEPLVRRLGQDLYFFGGRPTTPDLLLFAHISLILSPTLPNPLLGQLIRSTYPVLVTHHDRVLAHLFGSWETIRRIAPARRPTLWQSVTGWWAGENASNKKAKENKKTSQQKAFERGRMLWFLAAGVGMIGYLLASGIVQIQFGSTDDLEEEEVDEDEEEEDGDEDEDEEDLSPLTGLVDNDDE